ncbi:MAG: DUF2937 family protein [Verrucomicrobia bacterium]|nr:DUF2937 family protein [Verrucomicrobiota bacterium]
MASNSPWLAPLRPLGRIGQQLLDRALCVVGAVSLSQAPEFFQQYFQRLGGNLDEARLVLARYEAVARESGISLAQLVETTRAQSSAPVAKLGALIVEAQDRVETLAMAEQALRLASVWTRPFVFLAQHDAGITRGTWAVFKPAVPVTIEGAIYAGVGMGLALLVYQLGVVWPCRALGRSLRKPAAGTAGEGAAR